MSYVNSIAQGTIWMRARSIYPKKADTGAIYINEDDGCGYICLGKDKWKKISEGPPNPNIVTFEQLKKLYPDLKDLADKYTEWEILKRSGK